MMRPPADEAGPLEVVRVTDPLDDSRYYLYPADPTRQFVSVTTILGATEGKPFLTEWSAGVAARYAVKHLRDLLRLVEEEGEDAAIAHVKGEARRIRKIKADAGSYVHDVAEALALWGASPGRTGRDIDLPVLPEHLEDARYDEFALRDVVEWMVDGWLNFVADFDPEFYVAEMSVYHPEMEIAGTLDAIVDLHGYKLLADGGLAPAAGFLRTCIDIKTGRTLDPSAREQISAYRRMREALLRGENRLIAMPPTQAGAILHLRPNFHRGFRLVMIPPAKDAAAWNRFRRLAETWDGRAEAKGNVGKVVRPLRDGKIPPLLLADMVGSSGYGVVPKILDEAGFVSLDELVWMTATELLTANGIGKKRIDVIRRMLAENGLTLTGEAAEQEVA